MRFQIIPISGSLIATDQESSVTLEIHYLKKWMKLESSVTSLTWKRHWKNNRCPMGQLGSTSCRTIPLRQIGPVSPWVGCSSKGWLDSLALWISSGNWTRSTPTSGNGGIWRWSRTFSRIALQCSRLALRCRALARSLWSANSLRFIILNNIHSMTRTESLKDE